jgi:BlaI family transcriptional regulator, penicillinase repressor
VPTNVSQKLPRREREILEILFGAGEATAEEIRGKMADAPSYSAVRALLSRLETRGHIRHREDGPRYVFSPTTSPVAAGRAALKQFARTFFGGSFGVMATSLLREQNWTDEELDALHTEIEKARKERKKS